VVPEAKPMSAARKLAIELPPFVANIFRTLHMERYKAFLVGGSLRDALLGKAPADWDIATDARPEVVMRLFPGAMGAGGTGAIYGTVAFPDLGQVEVTTFRRESAYRDGRHPGVVVFGTDIEEDLRRRDFTVNAMAWDPQNGEIIDPTGGLVDLEAGVLRAVGEAEARFAEDALRLLRLVRLAVQLSFTIEVETWEAAGQTASLVDRLSRERVRDELVKMLSCRDGAAGLWMLVELGILFQILPELRGSDRLLQGKRGAPSLLEHLIDTVDRCPAETELRLAALLHDVGKLSTGTVRADGRVTFHGHEVESAELACRALERLRFSREQITCITALVRQHMVPGPPQAGTLRRWLGKYGAAWVRHLLALWDADAGGSVSEGWQAELERILSEEKVLRRQDLAVDGHDLMRELKLHPGPLVGRLLEDLFAYVLADPAANRREVLLLRAQEILRNEDRKNREKGPSCGNDVSKQ